MKVAAIAATTVVVLALVAGGYAIGSPAEARRLRFDERRVGDLQRIQGDVHQYWRGHRRLPLALDSLSPAAYARAQYRDPETRELYEFRPSADSSYELCATFTRPSPQESERRDDDRWFHDSGRACFALLATSSDPLRPPFTFQ